MAEFDYGELKLLRTCIRMYAKTTEKKVQRLLRKFGDDADVEDRMQKVMLLDVIDEKLLKWMQLVKDAPQADQFPDVIDDPAKLSETVFPYAAIAGAVFAGIYHFNTRLNRYERVAILPRDAIAGVLALIDHVERG